MVRVTAQEISQITGATLVGGPSEREVCGAQIDSRAVTEGCLFVAFAGERVDGNDYVLAAIEAGAGAVAMTRDPEPSLAALAISRGAALLRAADAEDFLQSLASWWRGQLGAVVVGVTGSSGKTTTKDLVVGALSTKMRTHGTSGNHNNLIGCPLTILSCPVDAQALVVEMGMNCTGEIARLARIARPHYGIVTNVGVAHIGMLGSRQAIAEAKAEIVGGLAPTNEEDAHPSRVFLWGEDDYTQWIADEVAAPRGVRVVRYGDSATDDARASEISLDDHGCASAHMSLPSGGQLNVRLSIPGAHNVRNALAAAAVADELGIAPELIAQGLAAVKPMKMRQQVVQAPGGFTIIDDSYNANTDSMRLAVDVLCTLPGRRHVACLGDMGELGSEEEVLHAVMGAYVAAKPVDLLVCVGELSRVMARYARLMGMSEDCVIEVGDAQAAIPVVRELVGPGDVLLVKASRSTALDQVVAGVML